MSVTPSVMGQEGNLANFKYKRQQACSSAYSPSALHFYRFAQMWSLELEESFIANNLSGELNPFLCLWLLQGIIWISADVFIC